MSTGDELHRGAVRVGDDPLVGRRVVRVDLRHDERDALVHPPRRGVVDDGRAAGDRLGRQRLGHAGAGREEGDVDPFEGVRDGLADLHRPAVHDDLAAGRAARGEQAQLTEREGSLAEDLDHRATDGPGGPDDGHGDLLVVHGRHGSAENVESPGTAGV